MYTNEKISDFMKQAQKMQQKMEKIKKEINATEIKGTSGAGLVTVTMLGNYYCKCITIHNEAWNEKNKIFLQDLVVSAVNNAVEKIIILQKKKLSLESSILDESNQ
ncbi:YbaB/EbfC family nucleoid-associated protein [Buchnera aphidicola]|uniref:Nucleoid-associated protein BUCINSTRO3249_0312 n=1 Tax=Buchnera aphidicola (Cinara strobi) TaxID=1921549 RepID=A0A3B1DS00_9GAMM|nr:YbaB/EbfC family nucleoid-associated protein [Buchnera aphidicola]VAX76754.1 Nucleoid-associated protein YbaB [Buchnera aphidicola (Cinara strobi)]